MNNRLLGAIIGLGLIGVVAFIVFNGKDDSTSQPVISPIESPKTTNVDLKSIKALIAEDKLDEASNFILELQSKDPDMDALGNMCFSLADAFEKKGYLVKARDMYEVILNKYQNVDNILEIQNRSGYLSMKILFSSIITEEDTRYEIVPGDTLSGIARKFNTTVDLIKASNSLASDVIRAGAVLKVSNIKYKILVDKSQNILTLFKDDGRLVKVYKVSTGENNCTPVGTFTIVNKIKDPVWYTQGAIVPPESPDNILGSRWLGLSEKGYGIHGTTEPASLGTQATKGCIRMLNSEVEELYTIIPVNTEVTILD
ncbi:MAG: L,D-transpeptidase family protein [Candidatus Omnitrophota bacterium]